MKALKEAIHERVRVQLVHTRLNQKQIGIVERRAEMVLTIGHRLAFHGPSVAHPHVGMNLMKSDLKLKRMSDQVHYEMCIVLSCWKQIVQTA